ncbi:MAG: ornithine carbamoyltransferase, partial [Pseudomonadota bacterium]
MSAPAHFLDLSDFEAATLRGLVDRGAAFKAEGGDDRLKGQTLALIFERPSTRTRISFEVAMRKLGGDVVNLSPSEMQLGRGETVADTARVLSRYVDAVMLRAKTAATLIELAAHAEIPVVNGLTDRSHPCQVVADVMTVEENAGPIGGKTVAWVGDANNVCVSWAHAAARFGFQLRVAAPERFSLPAEVVAWMRAEGGDLILTEDMNAAVDGADCVVTDTWVSMHNADSELRHKLLSAYRVDAALMARAKPDAIFLHCLPAHRGEEVSAEVIDGPQSRVFDEAENRLHAQMAILDLLL